MDASANVTLANIPDIIQFAALGQQGLTGHLFQKPGAVRALHLALEQAQRLTERDWSRLGAERERPLIEIALPEEEKEGHGQAGVLEFVSDVRHAYTPCCKPISRPAMALSSPPPGTRVSPW